MFRFFFISMIVFVTFKFCGQIKTNTVNYHNEISERGGDEPFEMNSGETYTLNVTGSPELERRDAYSVTGGFEFKRVEARGVITD